MTPAHSVRRLAAFVLLGALALVGLASCEDPGDPGAEPEAQPGPDISVFAQGAFGEVPVVPDSVTISERTEEEGTVAQSFLVPDRQPSFVMDFYQDALDDWTVVSKPEPVGPDALRASWLFQGRVLTVSASPAPAGEEAIEGAGEAEILTQYSLELHEEQS